MATKTTPFDPAEYLTSAEDQTELLNDALASGDAGYIANALGVIARAQGMSQVARDAGVTREALYKGLTTTGDPKLSTVVGVLKTLHMELSARKLAVRDGKVRRVKRPAKKAAAKATGAAIRSGRRKSTAKAA
jgi:probable addiction module antidote protein